MKLTPKTAIVRRDGVDIDIAAESLQVDDVFIVRPGSSVPTDGVVISGASSLDESAITGESVPVDKSVAATVFAGSPASPADGRNLTVLSRRHSGKVRRDSVVPIHHQVGKVMRVRVVTHDVCPSFDPSHGRATVRITERLKPTGDIVQQVLGVLRIHNPIALSSLQIETQVATVAAGHHKSAGLRPVGPAQLKTGRELERGPFRQRSGDGSPEACGNRGSETPYCASRRSIRCILLRPSREHGMEHSRE